MKEGDKLSKTLVTYFSRTGTTAQLAKLITRSLKADEFELDLEAPLPGDMYAVSDLAKQQLAEDNLPELKAILDFDEYETILIGGPVWSGDLSTPVASLLKRTNFGNHQVAGFCTASSYAGNYGTSFNNAVQGGQVKQGLFLSSSLTNEHQLSNWLSQFK